MRKCLPCVVVALLFTSTAIAGRPLVTNDAEPLEQGKFQIEAGLTWSKDGDDDHLDVPLAVTYGLAPGVEVGAGFGMQCAWSELPDGTLENEESFSDLGICAKWKFATQDRLLLDQALSATVVIPVADEDEDMGSGEVDYDLTWIGTRAIGEQWAVLANVGYTFVGDPDGEDVSDIVHYGPAVVWMPDDVLHPVAELVFEAPVDGGDTAGGANLGLRYFPSESLMLDIAAGTKVAGDWPDVILTAGLTWVP